MTSENKFLTKKFRPLQVNAWVEISTLAAKVAQEPGGLCNMGQGFSDMMAPKVVREAMKEVMDREDFKLHQYTRSYGHPRLVKALAQFYSESLGREIDPLNQVVVTIGADEALTCSFLGLVEAGDEVIIVEPCYDCYQGMVAIAGGTAVFIPLRKSPNAGTKLEESSDWVLDDKELESKFNSRTKAIVINSPQNPFGKVYSVQELEKIAKLCIQYDVIVINDCVYEHLVYDEALPRMATIVGMWERTLTIGSAGKSLNITGWKLGWAIGYEPLIHCLKVVHQSIIYTCPTPIQESVAIAFEEQISLPRDGTFFAQLKADLRAKRDDVMQTLLAIGLKPIKPEGGYFITADFSALDLDHIIPPKGSSGQHRGDALVKWLLLNKRLAVMPTFTFYSPEHANFSQNQIRFCFNKEMETIERAKGILLHWGEELRVKKDKEY